MAQNYLSQRRDNGLSQKYLSAIKIALERVVFIKNPKQRLERVEAKAKNSRTLEDRDRAYSNDQLHIILKHLSPQAQLSVLLAYNAGLRAEELLTLQRRDEAEPSPSRTWNKERFSNREAGTLYIVTGKNGLKREVMIEKELANMLESLIYDSPKLIYDRKQPFMVNYNVLGGKRFSDAF